jgi:hypothetical protein
MALASRIVRGEHAQQSDSSIGKSNDDMTSCFSHML